LEGRETYPSMEPAMARIEGDEMLLILKVFESLKLQMCYWMDGIRMIETIVCLLVLMIEE
jgi:hypothetical protein